MTRNRPMFACTGLLAAVVATSASAQSLGERIAIVGQQRQAERAATKMGILRVLLTTGVSVKFDQTKAKDAFAYLRQLLGVQMLVRWSDDPGASDGFDPETPITLEMGNAQALVVLERMIEMSTTEPATWQLRQGYLEVGPKSRLNARNALETQIYPIRDLLFEAPNFDNAPEFNLNQAVQQGNQGGGGGGNSPSGTVGLPSTTTVGTGSGAAPKGGSSGTGRKGTGGSGSGNSGGSGSKGGSGSGGSGAAPTP